MIVPTPAETPLTVPKISRRLVNTAMAARKVRDPLAIDNITLTPHTGFGPTNGDISDGMS